MGRKMKIVSALTLPLAVLSAFASGPTFRPQKTFGGNTLSGWHTVGAATWKMQNGQITGTPNGSGGWLVMDNSYQDLDLFSEFRCASGCKTGILVRATKNQDGSLNGMFVDLSNPDLPESMVTVDAQGKMTSEKPMARGGGLIRIAPPPDPNAKPRAFRAPTPNPLVPYKAPDTKLMAGDWNNVELFVDANIFRAVLNRGRSSESVATSDDGYGPIALYVGGTGTADFKGVAMSDMSMRVRTAEKTSDQFRMQKINDFYYANSSATADFNHDGKPDIVAGPFTYFGPDYMTSQEIWASEAFSPTKEFSSVWIEVAGDFNGDGWPDVMTVKYGAGPCAEVYLNPKGEHRRWTHYDAIDNIQSEIAILKDIDGDGKQELVFVGEGRVRYAKPDPGNPMGKWIVKDVSEQGLGTSHGLGVGDINGDGRLDILSAYGWWEAPTDRANGTWTYHPETFAVYDRGRFGGSTMEVYDVNGDGKADIVAALGAHDFGLAWFEQKRDTSGKISFEKHPIMGDFSDKNAGGVTFAELHGAGAADINGDGIPDFVTGKRWFSHLDTNLDPDPRDEAVIYWYETVRDKSAPGGARFVPHLIDNHSGVGSDLNLYDLNGDGAIDIVTSARYGTNIFWNKGKGAVKAKK